MHEIIVEASSEGEDRYRHQVVSVGDPLTIGSYVWLRAADMLESGKTSTGCSCRLVSVSDDDTGVLLAALGLGILYWRRRSC